MSYYSDAVVRDGAVAYWRLGETSGTTAYDSVGSNHGSIIGAINLNQSGAIADNNSGMQFNGGTSEIDIQGIDFGTSNITLECWLKSTSSPAGNFGVLDFWKSDSAVELYFSSTSLLFLVGSPNVFTGVTFPTDGKWHHIVGVLTRGVPDKVEIYSDGIKINQNTGTIPASLTFTGTQCIGTLTGNRSARFIGGIDEVAVYPKALTPSQIANHYGLGRLTTPVFGRSIQLGTPIQLVQSEIYALPARFSFINSSAPIEVSNDGITFIPLTNAETTGVKVNAGFIRSVNSNCTVITKTR